MTLCQRLRRFDRKELWADIKNNYRQDPLGTFMTDLHFGVIPLLTIAAVIQELCK